ncbi:bacterio-opsin activator domain-containing protein [Halarchaeum sp. CBA1220]|uniref:bacterio-opsin activator domain-containing protein n=1 Tax=Halarchaeum sp. CBA1220 TaxID=1853682 RepID=UPI0013149962|nr:bacterio-opsin activator domain-containing protein [Halarchaeum sp. CBA1220]
MDASADTLPDVRLRAMAEAPVGIAVTDPTRPDNPLVYVNDAFERITGYAREDVLGRNCRFLQGPETADEAVADLRDAVAAEEPTTVVLRNYRADGEVFWNEVTVAPLRDDDGRVTHFVGFQSDVTARKRAEAALERERASLARLLERLEGVVADVTRAVVSADGRANVEDAVCERLAAVDAYSLVWLGDVDHASGEVRPHAWRGRDATDVDVAALAVPRDADHPAARAVRTSRVQHVTGARASDCVPLADVGGVAAIPLCYRGTTYGVLVVAAPTAAALDESERTVLESLGRTVATALSARESRRLIAADQTVTVEFELSDTSLFVVDLSTRLDATVRYRGMVDEADAPLLFFDVDADAETVVAAADDVPAIASMDVVGDAEAASLFECRLRGGSLVDDLAERGVRVREMHATDGVGRIEVDLPASSDARAVVERVRERYPAVEVVSYRESERPPTTERAALESLGDALTTRQFTALQKAYLSGYYDANRSVTGDALAESMGISRSTFHQHLRAAERKVFAAAFDW